MSHSAPPSDDRPAPWAIGLLLLSVASALTAAGLLGLEIGLF